MGHTGDNDARRLPYVPGKGDKGDWSAARQYFGKAPKPQKAEQQPDKGHDVRTEEVTYLGKMAWYMAVVSAGVLINGIWVVLVRNGIHPQGRWLWGGIGASLVAFAVAGWISHAARALRITGAIAMPILAVLSCMYFFSPG